MLKKKGLLRKIPFVLSCVGLNFASRMVVLADKNTTVDTSKTTENTKKVLVGAVNDIQGVLTAICVGVGICCIIKVIITKLPYLDDPHTKNEMWRAVGGIGMAVATCAAAVWIAPWLYNLFN